MFIAVNYHEIDSEQKYERGIYPISPERLKHQLTELGKRYVFIGQNELLGALSGNAPLAKKSCLITFDDGLRTQFEYGMEILRSLRVPAVFFISSLPQEHAQACQVHKIQYILSLLQSAELLKKVKIMYQQRTGTEFDQSAIKHRAAQQENRYDFGETAIVKHILNSYIEPAVASMLVDDIFQEYCGDEKKFCRDTYLSQEHIQEINRDELFSIGLHTKSHINIPSLSKDAVARDIRDNYRYLAEELGVTGIKGISYPKGKICAGDVADKVSGIANELGLEYGFTLAHEANEQFNDPLLFGRYDTNDVVGGKSPIT